MMKRNIITLIAFISFSYSSANATNLQDFFIIARSEDAILGSAEYLKYAVSDDKDQSCRKLLPQLTTDAGYINYRQPDAGTVLGDSSATTQGSVTGWQESVSATVSQTLIDLPKFADCRAGYIKMNLQNANYELTLEDLIYRVSKAYIDVLSSQSQVKAANGAVELYESKLQEVRHKYLARNAPKRDVDESIAKLEEAKANKLKAENDLSNAKITLDSLSHGKVKSDSVSDLKEEFFLSAPTPEDPVHWADAAEKSNLKLIVSKLTEDVSHFAVKSAEAKYFPVVSAYGKHSEYRSNLDRGQGSTAYEDDRNFSSDAWGANLTWTFFTGGSDTAGVSAAKNRWKSTREQHEADVLDIRTSAQKSFINLVSMVKTVDAMKLLLVAAEAQLKDIESGVKAGTNTKTELLDARRMVIDAQSKLDASRYAYVMGMVDFWKAVGALSVRSIVEINGWLVQNNNSSEKENVE